MSTADHARTVLLETLPIGARFRVADRTATLLKLTPGRALVRYDNDTRRVQIGEDAEFERPGRPVSIAPRAEVEPLPESNT